MTQRWTEELQRRRNDEKTDRKKVYKEKQIGGKR